MFSQICRLSSPPQLQRSLVISWPRCGCNKSLPFSAGLMVTSTPTTPCSFFTPLFLRGLRAQLDHAENCKKASIHSKPAPCCSSQELFSPWEGGEGCGGWVQLNLLNAVWSRSRDLSTWLMYEEQLFRAQWSAGEKMLLLPEQVNLHLPEWFKSGPFKNNL